MLYPGQIIDEIDKSELEKIIDESQTFKEALARLGIDGSTQRFNGTSNSSIRKLKFRLNKDRIDYSKFNSYKLRAGKKNPRLSRRPIEDILVKNSDYNSSYLKTRLINEGLLLEKCCLCPVENIWNEKPLVLQLDHIDGDPFNNLIENLRILCPNCHSQTETFCSSNSKRRGRQKQKCKGCDNLVDYYNTTGFCRECIKKNPYKKRTIQDIPDKNTLLTQIDKVGIINVAKIYKVERHTVRRWYDKLTSEKK
jgi:hypothetical protein